MYMKLGLQVLYHLAGEMEQKVSIGGGREVVAVATYE